MIVFASSTEVAAGPHLDIKLMPDADTSTLRCPPFRHWLSERAAEQEEVAKRFERGILEHSPSPNAANNIFTKRRC